jgi:preprotein translocase subunit Sss1
VAAVDRQQKASGMNRQPDEIEMNETYDAVARLAGIGFVLCGLVFVVRSR